MEWTIMTVGESFTYQSKRFQAILQCSYSSQNGEGSLMTTRTPNWWAGQATIACIFGGHQLWEPYTSGQYVSTMVCSFNVLGCQLICNVWRQLEAVLNIWNNCTANAMMIVSFLFRKKNVSFFTFLSAKNNLSLPVGYIPATVGKTAEICQICL